VSPAAPLCVPRTGAQFRHSQDQALLRCRSNPACPLANSARTCRAALAPPYPTPPHPPGLDITLTNNNDWFGDVARPAFLRLALRDGAAATAITTPSSAAYTSPQSAPYLTLLTVPKPGDTLRWAWEGGGGG
jgi:hypothetical protein